MINFGIGKYVERLKNKVTTNKRLRYAMSSLENIPDGVFWVDDSGRIIYVNQAAAKHLGYTKEELLKMTIGEIDAHYELEKVENYREFYLQLKNKNQNMFYSAHRHRDGHIIPVEIITVSIKQPGEKDMGLAISRNIEERIRTETELRETNRRLFILYKIYQVSSETMDMDKLAQQTVELLKEKMDYSGIAFYIFDDENNKLRLSYSQGLNKEVLNLLNDLSVSHLPEKVMKKRGEDHNDRSLSLKELAPDGLPGIKLNQQFAEGLFFPILSDQLLMGVICILNETAKINYVENMEMLNALCAQLSTVMQNIRLFAGLNTELSEHRKTADLLLKANHKLELAANYDPLTNAWNRRWLLKNLNRQLALAHEQKSNLVLLLIDIDDFKQVNDKYGHAVGDQVLVEFVKLIKCSIRHNDSLTRWGGEEFIIMLSGVDLEKALQYAERLRKLVEEHSFPVVESLTVSIGVAELGEHEGIDRLLKRVDTALYLAKSTNKNKVVLSHTETEELSKTK